MPKTKLNLYQLPALAALDRGAFREAVERIDDAPTPAKGDAVGWLWRAEVLTYLDRRDAAREAIDAARVSSSLDDAELAGELARRATILRAQLAYEDEDYTTAETLARSVVDAGGDAGSTMRAAVRLGWALRKLGRYAEAVAALTLGHRLATTSDNDFMAGLALYNLAFCEKQTGSSELALEIARESIALLDVTEGLRFSAVAKTLAATLLSAAGSHAEALALYNEGEAGAVASGNLCESLWARNGAARLLLILERYPEAEARISDTIRWEREAGAGMAEIVALQILSYAQYGQGKFSEAVASAAEGIRLAGLRGNAEFALDCELFEARAKAAQGEDGAIRRLRDLLARVDASGTPYQRAEARIYLAEAIVAGLPIEAAELAGAALALTMEIASETLERDLVRLKARIEAHPAQIDADGVLTIDPRRGIPSLAEVRSIATEWCDWSALRAAGGVKAIAAGLLGIHKSHFSRFEGVRPRKKPSRTPGKQGSDER